MEGKEMLVDPLVEYSKVKDKAEEEQFQRHW